ncbi:MAG TPA: MerR family transcriptional regulator, partial [Firmicutes bacterium]|nr:MerR family transcriptional regulator [Bacillota bacterium]
DKGAKFYTINEAALMLNVHQQTLRNWEKSGLIKPLRIGARRIYTGEQVIRCSEIKEFSGKGVSLKGIKEILDNK